jgi:hypothetical protein
MSVKAKLWPTTEGIVVKSHVLKSNPPGVNSGMEIDKYFYPNILYSFSFNNVAYKNSKLYYGAYQPSETNAREFVEKYPTGSTVKIYYNPNNPNESVLEIDWKFKSFLIFGCGLLFAFLFFVVVYQGIVEKKRKHTTKVRS